MTTPVSTAPLWTAPLWTANALRQAVDGRMTRGFDVTGISIDTRSLRPGDLFIALVGENSDGHQHVRDALARGAAGALVHNTDGLPADAPLLVVADTQAGLHALGQAGRARFGGRAVAVTGSVGKTSTKEMLRAILAPSGRVHAAEASYNNHWGVPLTLARMPADADFLVAEIGMNHPGEIAPLARLVRPHVALVVSVEPAHIGHMGSLEAIADEKAAIAHGLDADGLAILPADHALLSRMKAAMAGRHTRIFGAAPNADARLITCDGDADTSTITACLGGQNIQFTLGAPGRHMAMNALAALLAADALGADIAAGARALRDFHPVAGRGLRRPLLGGAATLLDESYNASSASIRAALAVLKLVPAQRRIAVLGDMRELGEFGQAEHESLAPAVTASTDVLHCCGPLMRHLFDAAPEGIRGEYRETSDALAPVIAADLRPGDAVLVKGSLGSRMRIVVDALEAV